MVHSFALVFVIGFVVFWLAISTTVTWLGRWYALASAFPNRAEESRRRIRFASGMLGFVSMNSVLTLDACPTGLRVSMFRLFGPFCRPFFVPWEHIVAVPSTWLWMRTVRLAFGNVGSLTLRESTAAVLAISDHDARPSIPGVRTFTRSAFAYEVFRGWAMRTGFAATFFIVVPLLVSPKPPPFPEFTVVAILFPAVVFGIGALLRFFREAPKG